MINTQNYIGRDLPIGSEIYRAHIAKTSQVTVNCDADFDLPAYLTLSNIPLGPPRYMATPYGTGAVYPTNLAGVGVMLWAVPSGTHDYVILDHTKQRYSGYNTETTKRRATLNLSLIKLGPIASGSVINAIFPNIIWEIPNTPGYTGLPIQMVTVSFSGSIQLPSETCTAINSTVNMGEHSITDTFNSIGSYSKWVDASITLQNCPTFSGYYANGGFNYILNDTTGGQIVGDSGHTEGGKMSSNLLKISLSPLNSVNDTIISLTESDDSASGIGLQIGYTENDLDASPLAPERIWQSGYSWNITAPKDGRATIKIPLSARYYQTDKQVKPGKANSNIVFSVEYN